MRCFNENQSNNSRNIVPCTRDGASLTAHFIQFHFRIDLKAVIQNKSLMFSRKNFIQLREEKIKIISQYKLKT